MKPLTRDFWWMMAWVVFIIAQVIRLFLNTVETNEQRFSRFMIIVWIILATGMAISRFGRWRNAANKRVENTPGNE